MRTLTVNLTSNELSWQEINAESIAYYLGGRGLGIRYLYDNLSPGVQPLEPDNILTMWTSPLIATGALSMVKLCGMTKSPATGTILMSLIGGYFSTELRFAGADGLIFKGAAEHPVYLLIQDGKAELRSADHLWGKTTRVTHRMLEKELGLKRMQVSCIGPGGENQVLFASILHGGDAMGRGGIGAVMGSKKLKAIVASGDSRPVVNDPEHYREIVKRIAGVYKESMPLKLFGVTGTTRNLDGVNSRGILPTRNFQTGRFDDYKLVNAHSLYEKYVSKRLACYACPVRCRRLSEINKGQDNEVITDGPEYETLWSFSANCGNNSLEAVIAANDLCLEYGLDTISTGTTIAFAMECFENGLISSKEAGNINMSFGNHEAILELIHKIARREGIGNVLADGTRAAAAAIGCNASDYSMQVKGLELAGYEPRGAKGMALGYATSPRGGCHERGYMLGEVTGIGPGEDQYAYEGKADLVKNSQNIVALKDSLGFCVLASVGTSIEDMADLFSAATGFRHSADDLLLAGERICNLERLFNLREGFTRDDDTLPERFLKEAILGTNGEPQTVDLDRLLGEYYSFCGWNSNGKPLPETLERLKLKPPAPGSPVI